MAEYIMQRFSDSMHGDGEKLFPRLVNGQVVDLDSVATKIEANTSFKRGDVIGVLTEFVEQLKQAMAEGDAVKIEGFGTLRPILGLVDEEQRGAWTDVSGRTTTARNVKVKTINFRPDKQLTHFVEQNIQLVRVGDSAVSGSRKVKSSVEERAAAARQYLADKGFMRVADYASLTDLSHSSAAKELRLLADDSTSGIASRGSGAGKIYVLSKN